MQANMHAPLRVLFIAAEAEPFIKVGGLGDYGGSLPKAISEIAQPDKSSIDIRVVLPYHNGIELHIPSFTKVVKIQVRTKSGYAKGIVYQFNHHEILYYIIKRLGNPSGYENVYNIIQIDDARKYIFFSLACLELIKVLNWAPDIIHANDWHTAISVYELSQRKKEDKFYRSIRSLLTIHNLPYVGEGSQPVLSEYRLSPLRSKLFPSWAKFLPLSMGLKTADEIVAVSPTYAEELKENEFGNGFVQFFMENTFKTTGILNGINTSLWDPQSDHYLNQNYSTKNLEDRNLNKLKILEEFGFEKKLDKPLLILISRLTTQKGIDILLQGLPAVLDDDWSAIFLGRGQPEIEKALKELESKIHDRFKVILEFNNPLAHRLYASGDILLMPSLYEPCGLSQLIAMHYGCIPVARCVGGLKDSIITKPAALRTGYLFEKADVPSFSQILRKALSDFGDAKKWELIQKRAMSVDFSWNKSAGLYVDLYRTMLTKNIESN
jgi:starch synthase